MTGDFRKLLEREVAIAGGPDEIAPVPLAGRVAGDVDVSIDEVLAIAADVLDGATGGEDTRSPGSNPRGSTSETTLRNADESGSEGHVERAFTDAVEFLHGRLDDDLPDECEHATPREYLTDARGWDVETIDEKRLGYAPASPSALLDYLMQRGYDRETMLATGLYWESLTPIWRGRVVFPYLEDGRPVFAISREIGHPDDDAGDYGDGPAKYHKIPVGRDEVEVEEPIYGLDTVREGEPVLVTEGIADAITAHAAGYPSVSPVTTQFKYGDRERLVDVLTELSVPRVYVVQDAERPTIDVNENGELAIEQFGEGVRGAVATAGHLAENGLDARVAELPRPGLEKVDVDDYLREWADGDLTPILASAKPVEQHPANDPKRVAIEDAVREQRNGTGGATSSGDRSALFDLDIRDVTGLSWDYRGENPLGHHGDSRNYFVLIDEYGLAYDYKYKATYNALTYLLCETGERPASSPNGSLDDEEILAAWDQAKREGLIPDDDPIPRRALVHVAIDAGLCERKEIVDGWKLPIDAYTGALELLEECHGIDPGRRALSGVQSTEHEHVGVLPNSPRGRVLSTGWDWRHAGRRDAQDPTECLRIDEARERTQDAIAKAMEGFGQTLVDTLPSTGKSYGAIAAAAETDTPITFLTGRGRKEQYEQIREWCDEHDLEHYTLPSFTRDCPTANGEHGNEWRGTVMGWYNRGATPQDIHANAENELGRPLPCQAGAECPNSSLWRFDPEDYDVLIGHYTHAHQPKVIAGRVPVIDEFVGEAYETELNNALGSKASLASVVSRYLTRADAIPFDDYTDLLEHRGDDERRADALAWFLDGGLERDPMQVFDSEDGHALAPLAVFAILASYGNTLGGGWERASFPHAEDVEAHIGLFNREEHTVSILAPPAFEYARGLIALDGTPTREMWELALGKRLIHRQVLSDDERREYITDVLNLSFVRTTDAVKSYSPGESEIRKRVALEQDAALLEAIAEKHEKRPSLITTARAEAVYQDEDVLELVAEHQHYGDVLGSNQFAECRLGVVIGSRNFGPDYVTKWGAYLGEAIEPEFPSAENGFQPTEYGPVGNKIRTHMREHETLQAAMRFGRDGHGAVVYVHTNTLPDWVPIAGEGRVVATWSDGMKQVVNAAADLAEWTTAEIAAHPDVEIGERQVRNVLTQLAERGDVSKEIDGRGFVWRDDGLHRLNEHGEVDLEPVGVDGDVPETSPTTTYRWGFRNSSDRPSDVHETDASEPTLRREVSAQGGLDEYDPPD
ncbi:hypothetical protein [Natronorarus salvus]|uniref:hypothetical protein n=1 Tax=Natronorarus salvus TaxID=3117733 RepID=UPI002F26DDDD